VLPIALAISRLELLGLETPEVFAKRLPNQCGTIDSSTPRSPICGAEQGRVQYDLNSFHTVEHTPQCGQQSIAACCGKV